MAILKDLWTRPPQENLEQRTEAEYVVDLRNRVAEACEIAQQNLSAAKVRYERIYNRKARERWFEPGDEVLLLLPERHNKLQLMWRGPFPVTERVGNLDYRIKIRGKDRLYHANLLKPYHRREEGSTELNPVEECSAGFCPVVVEEDYLPEDTFTRPGIALFPLDSVETLEDVQISPSLNDEERGTIKKLCEQHRGILTDLPLRCTVGECELSLIDSTPVRVKQYPLPHSQMETIKEEVGTMLRMGVIEPCASPYSAPIVLVKKKDGKVRFCVDYRRLNQVLKFDAEPLPNVEALFAQLGQARFFTKIDLAKGYWQIPLREQDRPISAFTTAEGQFQWVVMPFGLKTAGATFSRIMRRILSPLNLPDIQNFMDDILIAASSLKRHNFVLRRLLQRLSEVQMSARPTKCFLGFSEISFLGHVLGSGQVKPETDKVEKIHGAQPPATKRELRAFLGLAGYYRKFIPGFAEIALPLTDKTKGREPDKVKWDVRCQEAFCSLKDKLCSTPVLVLPNQNLPFVLRTDASGVGLGAVLLQDQGEGLQPIAYASKKLSDAERRYHTIEQECLAVIWGIRKFYPYLYGRHFTLESDHHPLRYLHRIRPVSRRLMGWAMELQAYSFTFRHIKGVENLGADYLSRAP